MRWTRRQCAAKVPARAACSSNHCASEQLAVGMQAGNNRLQIVSIAVVWHERCHIYLWDASVCHADYQGSQFERPAYCVQNTPQENPPGLPQNASQTEWTPDFVMDTV